MHRRSFFAAVTAGALSLFGLGSAPPPGLRPVWRKTAAGWERCRMFDLQVGDVMRIERHPAPDDRGVETVEGVVSTAPELIDGQWGVHVEQAPPPT